MHNESKKLADARLRLAHADSPFGPWTIVDVSVTGAGDGPLNCSRSDPSPFVLPNGTVVVAFGAGDCHGGLETVGFMTSDANDPVVGPYRVLNPEPLPRDLGWAHCPTGNFGEDPYLFHDGIRGWHMLAHGLCDWGIGKPVARDLYSLHAFSRDAVTWRLAMNQSTSLPSLAWSKNVEWSNGSTTFVSRMERPQLVLDEAGKPIYLSNAVCPGGSSVGGTACHFTSASWALYRPIRQ